MGRAKQLPDNLMPAVMKLVGDSKPMSYIQAWLANTHKIKISQHAIGKRVGQERRARAPLTQAIIEQKIGATVGADVDRIEELIQEARKIGKTRDPEIKLKAIEAQRRLLDMRFGLNGARQPAEQKEAPQVNVNVAAMPGGQAVVLLPPEDDDRPVTITTLPKNE